MKQVQCIDCSNFNCFVHRFCTTECICVAQSSKTQIPYKKGQYIITEGSPVRGIYFIFKGKVKVVTSGIQNQEQIVRLAGDGHILGHRGYGAETYPIGAVALASTVVCFLDNDTFRELISNNPSCAHGLITFYSQELRNAERRNRYLSQMNINEKVSASILYYVKMFGYNQQTGLIDVDLPRIDIANLAGTNTDQVSRVLSELKKKGILAASGKHIYLLDHPKLKATVHKFDMSL